MVRLSAAGVAMMGGCLLLLPLACGQSKPNIDRFRVEKLAGTEAGQAKVAAMFPLRIEIRAVGKGRERPEEVLEVDGTKVRLTILEPDSGNIVTYEASLEKAGFVPVLAGYQPDDFRGAYRVSHRFLKDGDTKTLTTPSARYVFHLSSSLEMPPEFAKFGPLLKAADEAIRKRKSWNVIRTDPDTPKPPVPVQGSGPGIQASRDPEIDTGRGLRIVIRRDKATALGVSPEAAAALARDSMRGDSPSDPGRLLVPVEGGRLVPLRSIADFIETSKR